MKYRIRLIQIIPLIILLFGLSLELRAADSLGINSTTVIRSHLQSIAEEVVDQAKLDTSSRIVLRVEGEGLRTVVENAFIEILQKRNYTSILKSGMQSEQTLLVSLLNTDIKMRELGPKVIERVIVTTLEARTEIGAERAIRYLGTFHREAKDTAQIFPSSQFPIVQMNEDESVMQKWLTPLIILSGAVLIVYLLFTVRS